MREAIKQLWRARSRADATIALDNMERCPQWQWKSLSAIEFNTLIGLISAKGKQLV